MNRKKEKKKRKKKHNCLHVFYKMVFLKNLVRKAPNYLAAYEELI